MDIVPIFEKDRNRFFIELKDWRADDEWQARKIGWGASLVEGILWQMKFTGEVINVSNGILNRKATLGNLPIAIISGPLFELSPDEPTRLI